MRKYIVLVILIALISQASAKSLVRLKVDSLRLKYLKASKEEEEANAFYKLMHAYEGQDPLLLSYRAASEAVMAKYVWNPYRRLQHLKTARDTFEQAVKLDGDHPEIRFLRFTVEYYVPRYLNLSEHVDEDKAMVLRCLQAYPQSDLSPQLARFMRNFMLTDNLCTEAEKAVLRSVRI